MDGHHHHHDPEERLLAKGIKPTPNRVLVLKAMMGQEFPQSLGDMENELETLDKSSISRVLNLFMEKDIVHAFEDGEGIVRYEVCTCESECNGSDAHIHFWCESCHRTFCQKNVDLSALDIPEGFQAHAISFVIKGLCPDCSAKQ